MNDEQFSSGTSWTMITALGTALLSSACCILPLALVGLGAGGAWLGTLTALASYRWIFVGLSLGALGYAGYYEWKLSRPGCACKTFLSPTLAGRCWELQH